VNLYHVEQVGKGNSYVAPDPYFISLVLLFSSNLPWAKFESFFKTKKLLNMNASEQLTILRLIALQELLCISDEALLNWTRNQFYLFRFIHPEFKPKLPSLALLNEFRSKLDDIGLLKPFRKQCQRLIKEQENSFPPLLDELKTNTDASTTSTDTDVPPVKLSYYNAYKVSDVKVDLLNLESSSGSSCPNCGSYNVIKLAPSQVASSLPNISFSRCRFCGNTFRDNYTRDDNTRNNNEDKK